MDQKTVGGLMAIALAIGLVLGMVFFGGSNSPREAVADDGGFEKVARGTVGWVDAFRFSYPDGLDCVVVTRSRDAVSVVCNWPQAK